MELDEDTNDEQGFPMTHILADHLRSEFLATPELVRLDMAYGANGLEPTLLIKANLLALKYLLRRREFKLVVTTIGQEVAYAVEIPDDPAKPCCVWSILSGQNEIKALETLSTDPRCVVFLLNELAVSVAWAELNVSIDPSLAGKLKLARLHPRSEGSDHALVGPRLDEIHAGKIGTDTQVIVLKDIDWHELEVSYITNRAGVSSLSLFSADEGGQQEEIAVWLTDGLQPQGCVKSPQVQEKSIRELSDILLTYELGSFLIESKALNILTRKNLPNREELRGDLVKHVRKARKQLGGAVKNLRKGLLVTDGNGKKLEVEREKPAHAIILVPDLSLFNEVPELGLQFICQFMQDTGCYLHILDPAELLRVVQAAGMIAGRSNHLTKMMAFDWYLIERAKIAASSPTPHFAVLYRNAPSLD